MTKEQAEERERKETPVQVIAPPVETPAQPVAPPVARSVSPDALKTEKMTPLHKAILQGQRTHERLQKLEVLLKNNRITKEDFEKRKLEILTED